MKTRNKIAATLVIMLIEVLVWLKDFDKRWAQ